LLAAPDPAIPVRRSGAAVQDPGRRAVPVSHDGDATAFSERRLIS